MLWIPLNDPPIKSNPIIQWRKENLKKYRNENINDMYVNSDLWFSQESYHQAEVRSEK